jgi:hypothetical protein
LCGHSADINRDGTVNNFDLRALSGADPTPPEPTPTPTALPLGHPYACWAYTPVHVDNPCDANGDGVIGSGDLSMIINQWGSSPPFVE